MRGPRNVGLLRGYRTQARAAEGGRLRAYAAGAECLLISQEGCMTSLAQSQETFLLPRHQGAATALLGGFACTSEPDAKEH
jgi:hypothetical protein